MKPFGGSAEMKLGSHRHERLKLPQFHKLTVPLKIRTAQERVSAGHTLLFGRTEESVSELPLDPRSAPCHGAQARRWTPRSIAARLEPCSRGRIGQIGCRAAGDEMVPLISQMTTA